MASVKVAVRVRPFNQRELDMGAKLIIQMDGKKTRIINNKVHDQYKDFTFDHSYWSFNTTDSHFASQEQVFGELGKDVVDAAFEGYNACVFAYGQTGSGKTFTMTGTSDNQGLIPRICESLFSRMASDVSYHTEVSYLEIYNERVKDLLHRDDGNTAHNLRVREHPRHGPYVSDLSRHLVSEYSHIQELMARGNHYRTTASTNMNDTSSRSHAIFTLMFVQAGYSNDMPSETVSKVHLVDLAGSERADATGATGQRLKEGAHINKSLVTLGSVISALAELSNNSLQDGNTKKSVFIPYRDSVLTWLLKDSLGGNSKTIMIAAVSPADCNYSETLSTLRYANRAKNIINKPTVNEDPNVKLIKELRDEITKLKRMLCNGFTVESQPQMLATLQKKEAQEKVLTEKWTEKWKETQKILQEQKALGLRKFGTGVVLDSDMPHLIGIDDDLLSTGVTLYHLKEGETTIGTEEATVKPDIILNGIDIEKEHCSIVLTGGVAMLTPKQQAQCWVNCVLIDKPTRLSQGSRPNVLRSVDIRCNILLGRTNMFRYNDPVEAEKLRKEGCKSLLNLSRLSLLSWSTSDLAVSSENLNSSEDTDKLDVIEQQKAELVKEKEAFKLEQAEKKQDWENEQRQKREALEAAQKQLEMERQQMETAYQEQCKRLAEDWQQLEKHQADNLATLRSKEAELDKKKQQLECERDEEMASIHVERKTLKELQANLEKHKKHFVEFVSTSILQCVAKNNSYIKTGYKLKSLMILAAEKYCESLKTNFFGQETNFSPETSPSQDSQSLSLCSNSVRLSSPDVCGWMNLNTVSSLLKDGIVKEIINHHKVTLANLESELRARALSVSERELRVQQIDKELQASACETTEDTYSSKENLMQRTSEELYNISQRKQLLNLDLAPVSTSNSVTTIVSPRTCDTYHTAQSPVSPVFMSDSGVGLCLDELCLKTNWADESDVSSTDDSCKSKCGTDARHRVAHYKPRNTYKSCSNNKRPDKTEIIKSLKQLAQQINKQRLHIMHILEVDSDTMETNRQITILQDLKKKYIQLERELQMMYSKGHSGSQEESDDMSTSADETTSESVSDAVYSNSKYTGNGRITHSSYDIPASLSQQKGKKSPSDDFAFGSISSQHLSRAAPYNFSLARSMPALNPSLWEEASTELNVRVPTYILRGAGSATHYAYEVRLTAGGECWSVLRRYSRFRELHICMKSKYGAQIAALPFPPRRLFSRHSEWLAKERRPQLELYLQRLLDQCYEIPGSPLHTNKDKLTKFVLYELSPFFRRGIFETGKYGTA